MRGRRCQVTVLGILLMCSCSSGTKSRGEPAEDGGAGSAGTSGSSGSGASSGTNAGGGSGASSGGSGGSAGSGGSSAGKGGTDPGGSAGAGGTQSGSAGQSGGGQGGSGAQSGAGGTEGGSGPGGAGAGGAGAGAGGAGAGGTSANPYAGCEGEDTLNNSCPIAGSFCHPTFGCQPPCPTGTASCPAPPAGGTATPYCQDRLCRLDCTLDKTCPAGMTCHEVNQFCTGNPL